MNKLESTVESVKSDLDFGKFNREEFLAKCAVDKIKNRNDLYNRQLDKFLSDLSCSELYESDLFKISSSLKSLSKLISISCTNFMKMISKYEKNIFGK